MGFCPECGCTLIKVEYPDGVLTYKEFGLDEAEVEEAYLCPGCNRAVVTAAVNLP